MLSPYNPYHVAAKNEKRDILGSHMSVCPEGRDPLTNSIGFKADHDELKLGLVVTYCTLWAVNYLDMRLND